jgi:phosphoglycerol transferase MdoB-like AlkP superfamily enzyme
MPWTRYIKQAFKDLRAYLYFVVLLSTFRVILITIFIAKKEPESGFLDILSVLANGFRFDSRVAIYFIFPTLVMSLVGIFFQIDRIIDRARLVIAIVFTSVTLLICGSTIPYFQEYDDQFNQWLYGLIYDDFGAIVRTVWSQVPVIRMFFLFVFLMAVLSFLLKKFLNRDPRWIDRATGLPVWGKTIGTLCFVCLVVVAARGSAGPRPVQLKDVSITQDLFLNKTILNPYEALRYLYSDFESLRDVEGITTYLPDGDIRSAAKSFYNDPRNLDNIDDYMLRMVQRASAKQPKHIFLIVMEGYSAWTMLDRYQSLQTSPQLKSIAEAGLWIKRFLPASNGTPATLTTIISGLPDMNLMINYQPSSRQAYPTSIAPIFKRLGYKTRFFYGGYLSWQRIGDFCRGQGFEEIFGAPHMGQWAHSNEWGVDDEALFNFIEKTVADDEPSFNMIMTTSNHPPYDIEVFKRGYPVKEIPPDLADIYTGDSPMIIYGHMWYADQCLGKFIHRMEKTLSDPVFAMTGDHFGRHFLNKKPTMFERNAVPLVLYGPDVLKGKHLPENAVGTHIDISTTLIELAAPPGFTYHGVGRNLLDDDAYPVAVGTKFVAVTPDFIIENLKDQVAEPFPETTSSAAIPLPADADELLQRANEYYAIGWWRVMRGALLP